MITTCWQCGKEIVKPDNGFTTGYYGVDDQGHKVCYACCAEQDRAYMVEHGRITLYLSDLEIAKPAHAWRRQSPTWGRGNVTNWPGSLRFTGCNVKRGNHNIAGTRYDVWFAGPDGHLWHGVQYGENTQIVHCKRTKQAA